MADSSSASSVASESMTSASSIASDSSSIASESMTSASSVASESVTSASEQISSSASASSSQLSTSAASAASTASATASKMAADAQQGFSNFSKFGIFVAILVTVLAGLAAVVYFSGYADDLATWATKKYYVGKAKAEVAAVSKVGGEKAQAFMKDSLKKNPVMGEDELEQVAPGLGSEAAQQGLSGVDEKLGGLGKF